MAYTTLTRYLKLKVDSDLSADAVYNLQRIDALASTFVIDATEKLKIQSKGNIEIEPNDLALGGTGTGGAVEIGTSQHSNVTFQAFTSSFKVDSGIETKNQAANASNYLKLAFEASGDLSNPRILKFDLGAVDRDISFDSSGTVVTKDGSGNVTIAGDMTAAGFVGDLTGNVTGNVTGDVTGNLTGNVTGSVTGNLTGNVTGDVTGNLTGDVTGNADTATDLATGSVLSVGKGGTGATTAAEAAENLLPAYGSNANKVLGLNSTGDGLEWKAAGSGVVEEISVDGPLSIDNSVPSLPSISLPQADTDTDGYLSSTDWDTFNGKEPAITSSGNASQFWNGNKTFAALTESDIPTLSQSKVTNLTTDLSGKEPTITASGNAAQFWNGNKTFTAVTKGDVGLGNVDNTSDANKPISSATQTALNAKYDASNPSNYVDAAGAKSAAVVNSTAGSETDQAPSVSAMKSYVSAASGPRYSTTWTVADGNSKTVTHNLDSREVSITLYDENYETVYIDTETRTSVNAINLVRIGTATGTWTVIVKKL